MINNLTESFKKEYQRLGDKLVIDNHTLKFGIYIRVSNDLSKKEIMIIKPKQDVNKADGLYKWFREVDFYSDILGTNKALDKGKKIQSNNSMAYFFKKEVKIKGESKPQSIFNFEWNDEHPIKESMGNYFEGIKKLYKKVKVREELFNKVEQQEKLWEEKGEEFFYWLSEQSEDFENYIKIFFDEKIDCYKEEGEIYLKDKIFNSDAYNLEINDELYGLSNSNMGMNSKKPYLEHKTMRCEAPFRLSQEDALLTYKYFLWLKSQGLGVKEKVYDHDYSEELSKVGTLFEDKLEFELKSKNGEIEIRDFDIIPGFNERLEYSIKDVLNTTVYNFDSKKRIRATISSGEQTKSGLVKLIDEYFYKKRLLMRLYCDDEEFSSLTKSMTNYEKQKIYDARILMRQFKDKGIDDAMISFTKNNSLNCVKDLLLDYKKSFSTARDSAVLGFNLMAMLLKKYSKEGDVLIKNIKYYTENIESIIKDNEKMDCEGIEEYSFLAGQLAYYILSLSKKDKKTHDAVESFLNCKTVKQMNKEMTFWFTKYSYRIYQGHKKFNKSLSMILAFDEDQKIEQRLFLAGYLADNILYLADEKKEESKKGAEEDESKQDNE